MCLLSITPELLQNPTALSSNTQLLSAGVDEATEEAFDETTDDAIDETAGVELLLELITAVLELDFDVVAVDVVAAEEAAAPHKLPFTFGVPAVPFA